MAKPVMDTDFDFSSFYITWPTWTTRPDLMLLAFQLRCFSGSRRCIKSCARSSYKKVTYPKVLAKMKMKLWRNCMFLDLDWILNITLSREVHALGKYDIEDNVLFNLCTDPWSEGVNSRDVIDERSENEKKQIRLSFSYGQYSY